MLRREQFNTHIGSIDLSMCTRLKAFSKALDFSNSSQENVSYILKNVVNLPFLIFISQLLIVQCGAVELMFINGRITVFYTPQRSQNNNIIYKIIFKRLIEWQLLVPI